MDDLGGIKISPKSGIKKIRYQVRSGIPPDPAIPKRLKNIITGRVVIADFFA